MEDPEASPMQLAALIRDLFRYSPRPSIRERFEAAGWNPDRRINSAPYAEALEKRGVEVFESARRLFSNIGELQIKDGARIDFSSSLEDCFEEAEETWIVENEAGTRLCPLGFSDAHVLGPGDIFISESAQIFFDSDRALYSSKNLGIQGLFDLLVGSPVYVVECPVRIVHGPPAARKA